MNHQGTPVGVAPTTAALTGPGVGLPHDARAPRPGAWDSGWGAPRCPSHQSGRGGSLTRTAVLTYGPAREGCGTRAGLLQVPTPTASINWSRPEFSRARPVCLG